MEKKFKLLRSDYVYGIWHYASVFAARVEGKKEYGNEAMRVYNFKKFGTGAEDIKLKIEAAAAHFGCDKIVAVPGHTTETNELQTLIGIVLRRTAEVPSRKYNHGADIDFKRECETLELPDGFTAKRVLVVDDVVTTGKTMAFYRGYFRLLGIECAFLALGINYKLNPSECDFELSYFKQDAKTQKQLSQENEDRAANIDLDLAEARKKVDAKRKAAAEVSLSAWIRTYCVGVLLNDAPPKPHGEQILREMDEAVGSSRPYQILVSRGGGKTSYTECCAAYAIATGRRKFCLISSINAKQAQQILRELTGVFTSEPFATDYPDIALPILLLDGHGRRSQRQGGHATKVRLVTDETMLPTITMDDGTPAVASGACIRAKALKSVRGTKNGTQRPDLIILDDLQTREIAENEERVADVLSLIRGDVMGLAGKSKAAIISTATTIAADDLTEVLAADKAWKTTKNPAVLSWPKEWAKPNHGLWGHYFSMFDDENANDQKHTRRGGSAAFYKENRKAMDEGADILNWENYDRKSGQHSGLQKLMDAFHQMGEVAFMAEYQMQPVRNAFLFDITSRIIASRVRRGVSPCTIPEGSVLTVAATDINPGYAITTSVVTFDVHLSGLVTAYHVKKVKIPEKLNDVEFSRRVYEALAETGREICALGVKIDKWGVDAGGRQFEAATRFAKMSFTVCGLQATPMLGRAGQNWNPNVRSKIRSARNSTVVCQDPQHRRWLAFNADEYKERAQRAWLTEVGAPGGLSLFDGGANHTDFATQVANEKLVAKKLIGDERWSFKWKTKDPHDYGDCLAMCYALAGSEGLTGGDDFSLNKKKSAKVIVL